MEEQISGIEDKKEEIDSSVKQYAKPNPPPPIKKKTRKHAGNLGHHEKEKPKKNWNK